MTSTSIKSKRVRNRLLARRSSQVQLMQKLLLFLQLEKKIKYDMKMVYGVWCMEKCPPAAGSLKVIKVPSKK